MSEIKIMAPCCDTDIIITARDILRGVLHRKETHNRVLVGCPWCHTALRMDEKMPTDTPLFEAWVRENKDDANWLPCVPWLDDTILGEPAGSVVIAHKTKYRAGAGTELLTRAQYMDKYGQDPERAVADNPSLGGKPFVTGATGGKLKGVKR
ncbi:MAG: hypothetical protein ACYDG4_15190 [Desulfuromonadaceae bacterium]